MTADIQPDVFKCHSKQTMERAHAKDSQGKEKGCVMLRPNDPRKKPCISAIDPPYSALYGLAYLNISNILCVLSHMHTQI
jgi:hypothetical protein